MGEKPVKVKDAPGLKWFRRRGDVWEARWRARDDIVEKGFEITSQKLWSGTGEPTKEDWDWMADRCRELQQEMLVFARGGLPEAPTIVFVSTLQQLMDAYKTDPDSAYHKLRYKTREHYSGVMKLIAAHVDPIENMAVGDFDLADIKARLCLRLYEQWSEGGAHIPTAHGRISMIRTLAGFGATILENAECMRLSTMLSKMKFAMPKARESILEIEHVIAVRAKAHEKRRPSVALAQAFQFECTLRQKDVIGEWMPLSEPVKSALIRDGWKWARGLDWKEIDDNFVLQHVTSKRQKKLVVDLRLAPMVLEELTIKYPSSVTYVEVKDPDTGKIRIEVRVDRSLLPGSGPIIVSEWDELPWTSAEFRRIWRQIADAAGVPKDVKNMDSRAGAITEATDSDAPLEDVRHLATHSNISMTQRYSRAATKKIAKVMKLRVESRNKGGTE